jgi:uncharacterized protein YceK
MRHLLLVLTLLLAGCQTLHEAKVPTTAAEAQQEARKAVDEAYLTIIAIARVVRANLQAGVYTQAQADAYQAKLASMLTQVTEAEDWVKRGLPDAAQRAKLLNRLLVELQKEVAAKARQS